MDIKLIRTPQARAELSADFLKRAVQTLEEIMNFEKEKEKKKNAVAMSKYPSRYVF